MDLLRALRWESRSFAWMRSGTVALRDVPNEAVHVVPAMELRGWPDQTEFAIEVEFRGDERTLTTPLWIDPLSPPGEDHDGDEQTLSTIMVQEVEEEVLYATSDLVPEPQATWVDLQWEAHVFESVRAELGRRLETFAKRGRSVASMGFRHWPRETELFVEFGQRRPSETRAFPIWNLDPHMPPEEYPGDPELTVTLLLAQVLPLLSL